MIKDVSKDIEEAWNKTIGYGVVLKENTLKCEFYHNLRERLGDDYRISTEFYMDPRAGKIKGEFIDMIITEIDQDLWRPKQINAFIEIKYLTREYISKKKAERMIRMDIKKLSKIKDVYRYMLYIWEFYQDKDEFLQVTSSKCSILPYARQITKME